MAECEIKSNAKHTSETVNSSKNNQNKSRRVRLANDAFVRSPHQSPFTNHKSPVTGLTTQSTTHVSLEKVRFWFCRMPIAEGFPFHIVFTLVFTFWLSGFGFGYPTSVVVFMHAWYWPDWIDTAPDKIEEKFTFSTLLYSIRKILAWLVASKI